MKLTPNEIRDITQRLEQGKPLPDKYRFLLFEDKREVELVWNGKSGDITHIALPFQTIEQVDEPRTEATAALELFDSKSGRQIKGWTNKLIWGDNKLILASLKQGALRETIEAQGGLKLIYIDPPFDVGADFSMNLDIGGDTFTKKPNILEEIAYRDTWGQGQDSFIAMIYERLVLMRDLLAEDGSIYVHCDWRVNSLIRLVLDEVFGRENFRNEIVWCYTGPSPTKRDFPRKHETILKYGKSQQYIFNPDSIRISYKASFTTVRGVHGKKDYDKIKQLERHEKGKVPEDWWTDISNVSAWRNELVGYPTQKPEKLLERIVKASSNEGDLVADFFCGSGTTTAVAEQLGRKWIATDLGKFAIHTTRKRMIGVQRQLKADQKPYRAFEILNLGKYERQHYIGVNPNLREEEKQKQLEQKEEAFVALILRAYRAEQVKQFKCFQGKRGDRLVAVGPVNLPVTRLFVEEIIGECRQKRVTQADVLGFEFEMGLFPNVQEEARNKGIDLAMKYIPAEVFDKRAVEKGQVVFHDVAYIEIKLHVAEGRVAVELTDFSVFYSQDSVAQAEAALKAGKSKVVVENGQVLKISKDKNGQLHHEALTKHWTDWVDYWSVDFNFESKREMVRSQNAASGETEEIWTGDFVFENEWQSFRTRQNRKLELKSVPHPCESGRRKLAVKVVDIFGNDTMKVVGVSL